MLLKNSLEFAQSFFAKILIFDSSIICSRYEFDLLFPIDSVDSVDSVDFIDYVDSVDSGF